MAGGREVGRREAKREEGGATCSKPRRRESRQGGGIERQTRLGVRFQWPSNASSLAPLDDASYKEPPCCPPYPSAPSTPHPRVSFPVASWSWVGLAVRQTYGAGSGLLVAVLAVDLEGDIVGGVALDLERAGGQVVEVLVEQLEREKEKQKQIVSRKTRQWHS